MKIVCGPKGFNFDDHKSNLDVQLYSIPDNKRLAAANKKKREATAKGKQHAKHGLHKGKKR